MVPVGNHQLPETKQIILKQPACSGYRGAETVAKDMNTERMDILFSEAVARYQKGDLNGAEKRLRAIIRQAPETAEAHHLLGIVALAQNRLQTSCDAFEQAVCCEPETAKYAYNLGVVLQRLGETGRAIHAYDKTLALDPDYPGARNNLGAALRDSLQFARAEYHLKEALAGGHNSSHVWNNLGSVLRDQGRIEAAIDAYQKASTCDGPNSVADSNRLLSLHYRPTLDLHAIFDAHRHWAAVHCPDDSPNTQKPVPDMNHRRRRIGYVSADFITHSVSFFLKSILPHHDRELFDVYCYHTGGKQDPTTAWFKQLPVVWRDIHGLSDPEAARQIRKDGVDILIDCSGHTDGNRLKIFALKPAPIQITYLGYPDTTGLLSMDFRFTDAWADPPEAPTPASERLVRIPGGFLCYTPPHDAPAVGEPPALKNGYLTFGSFNTIPKLNSYVLDIWGRLLRQIPTARLLLKARQFHDETVAAYYLERFQKRGISVERIDIIGPTPGIESHFRWYQRVDAALDPFPYNGTTSTYDALYMGVPVISLKGYAHAGRVGHSILSRMGLSQLVADTEDRYIAIAAFLSENIDVLSGVRRSLRDTVMAQNNGREFTLRMERVLLKIWQSRFPS